MSWLYGVLGADTPTIPIQCASTVAASPVGS